MSDVVRFVEKPNRKAAEEFLASGKFLWNGGMFVARADTLIAEMQALCPDVGAAQRRWCRAQGDALSPWTKRNTRKARPYLLTMRLWSAQSAPRLCKPILAGPMSEAGRLCGALQKDGKERAQGRCYCA